MRTIRVGSHLHDGYDPVIDLSADQTVATLGNLIDFYCKHHGQPSCCPPGDCRGTCSGLAAVMSNASTLLESMTAKPCVDVVTVALAKKYAGEALAHLTADGCHDVESNDSADVRLARAVRVLAEFITRIDPPKDHS